MAKFFNKLNESHQHFIIQQKVFFTATAPQNGRINLSPKGMDTFRVFNQNSVGYLDLTGSGNETAAHTNENGRITVMFCSFENKPLILRLYGTGTAITQQDPKWHDYIDYFNSVAGQRQIIVIDIESIQTSCGYAVPLFSYQGERDTLQRWAHKKGESGIKKYWEDKNQMSIDGLPTPLLN